MNYTTAAIVSVYLYCIVRNCFRNQEKMFKTSVNVRPYCPLSSFYSTRTNLILPESIDSLPKICTADIYMSIFISFHAITFRSRTVSASQTGAKTEFNVK